MSEPVLLKRILVQHHANTGDAFDIDYATALSASGLTIATTKKLPRDTTLHVQFSPNRDANLVSAFCKVTNVDHNSVRAEFVALDADAQRLITSALRT